MYKVVNQYFNRLQYKAKVYAKFGMFSLLPARKNKIVDDFHKLFYDSHILGKTWNSSTFLGIAIQKCPFDLFVYQEILSEVKPDVIVEAGTEFGGGALFLASMCDLLNHGKVITIDKYPSKNRPKHKRITYLLGSSTDEEIVRKVKKQIKKRDRVLIILDSDHSKNHVLSELHIYNSLVSKNSYIIVEDGNVNGHPVNPHHGPGPLEAIEAFMKNNNDFIIDKTREKYYLSFNPNGYLKKIR